MPLCLAKALVFLGKRESERREEKDNRTKNEERLVRIVIGLFEAPPLPRPPIFKIKNFKTFF